MTTTKAKPHPTRHTCRRAGTGRNLTRQMNKRGKHLLPITVDSKISSINSWEAKAAISVKRLRQAFSPGARVNTPSSTQRKDTLIPPIRASESPWETCVSRMFTVKSPSPSSCPLSANNANSPSAPGLIPHDHGGVSLWNCGFHALVIITYLHLQPAASSSQKCTDIYIFILYTPITLFLKE